MEGGVVPGSTADFPESVKKSARLALPALMKVATIDKTGLLTTVRRGEATMLARYEGSYAASTAVSMGDRTGFAWEPRPVNNWIDELVARHGLQMRGG